MGTLEGNSVPFPFCSVSFTHFTFSLGHTISQGMDGHYTHAGLAINHAQA
jgi:hypothetical protein